jgi:hypothetical protein
MTNDELMYRCATYLNEALRPVGFQPCSLASRMRAEASAFFLLVELPTTLPVLIAMIFQGFLPLRLIIL